VFIAYRDEDVVIAYVFVRRCSADVQHWSVHWSEHWSGALVGALVPVESLLKTFGARCTDVEDLSVHQLLAGVKALVGALVGPSPNAVGHCG
jgi:hypothetical protein